LQVSNKIQSKNKKKKRKKKRKEERASGTISSPTAEAARGPFSFHPETLPRHLL
jgi:hypothetical protein